MTKKQLLAAIKKVYGLTAMPNRAPFQPLEESSDLVRVSFWDLDHLTGDERVNLVEYLMTRATVSNDGHLLLLPGDEFFHHSR